MYQTNVYSITTPRGSVVPDCCYPEEYLDYVRAAMDADVAQAYPNAVLQYLPGESYSSSHRFNCHAYAWHLSQGHINDRIWLGCDTSTAEDIYFEEPDGDGSYDYVSSSKAKIISYSGNHSAVKDAGGYYISKWGPSALMKHTPGYCPSGYGSPTSYFRRSVDVPIDQPTIQSAVNAGSGQTVHVSSGTYSEDISMKSGVDVDGTNSAVINGLVIFDNVSNCDLTNISVLDEIQLNSGSNNKLSHVNTEERIVYNYCDNPQNLLAVTANHSDKYGVKASGTGTLYIDDFTSTASSRYGIYANNNSDLSIESPPNYYPYEISEKDYALQISSGSDAFLQRVRFSGNMYDIYTYSDYPAPVIACDCEITGQIYGDVSIDDPNWCGGSRQNILANKTASLAAGDLRSVFEDGVQIYRETQNLIKADLLSDQDYAPEKYQAEYQASLEKFLAVVTANSEVALTRRALAYVAWCYHGLQQTDELADYLKALMADAKYPDEIQDHARMLLVPVLVQQKEYKSALKEYDVLVKTSQNKEMQAEAQYGQGIIYGYFLKDKEQAAAAFEAVVTNSPDTHLAEAALDELEQLQGRKTSAAPETPTEFAVQNYPNPFNPETEIQYALPEAGKVSIKIFDIQGREVETLVESSQPAGVHTIKWNGQSQNGLNVASGMYFYRILYNGKILNKKMMIIR